MSNIIGIPLSTGDDRAQLTVTMISGSLAAASALTSLDDVIIFMYSGSKATLRIEGYVEHAGGWSRIKNVEDIMEEPPAANHMFVPISGIGMVDTHTKFYNPEASVCKYTIFYWSVS